LARWLVRGVVRPGLSPRRALAWRRARVELQSGIVPLPRGVARVPGGDEHPGSEWILPAGTRPDSAHGAILYLHGGGFILGSPATSRGIAARLARFTGLPVLAAHYRLAPETPYPGALDDVQAAWRRITIDGERPIALAGDSAGGWLALALALSVSEAGLPRPSGLGLFSPLVDLAAAEADPDAVDAMLPPGFVAEGVRAWRGNIPATDPRFNLLDGPLETLPPVFISFDRDEALAEDSRRLASAARAAGVQVRVEEASGLFHAWPILAGLFPEADATVRAAAAMLAPARAGASR
jgi:epsilon-lactone hydrolase